ncbi:hypothetical protein [Tomitella cavernea]|uniref:Ferredoxin n=1 Tax=Tomitella cavernea TaxID=1387982 RepID=A0ABP9CKE3_9ACTN|nr:hypothetical protein [Tomitella cavernea]
MDFHPVSCDRCGTEVLVHKSSFHQTSVQWNGTAAQNCELLQSAASEAKRLDPEAHSCPALRASIERAVVERRLAVPEDDDERTIPGLGSPGEAATERRDD